MPKRRARNPGSARLATPNASASIATRPRASLQEPQAVARIRPAFSRPLEEGDSTASRRGSILCPAQAATAAPASSFAWAAIESEARAAIHTAEDLRATRTSYAICPAAFATEQGD